MKKNRNLNISRNMIIQKINLINKRCHNIFSLINKLFNLYKRINHLHKYFYNKIFNPISYNLKIKEIYLHVKNHEIRYKKIKMLN